MTREEFAKICTHSNLTYTDKDGNKSCGICGAVLAGKKVPCNHGCRTSPDGINYYCVTCNEKVERGF